MDKAAEYMEQMSRPLYGIDWFREGLDYWVDSCQRSVLFMDVLRKRGNNYLDHIAKGQPPVLSFDYEIVLDGREFEERPVNYAVVRIIPGEGIVIDQKKRPVLIIDPRAGHGPGIGGFKDDSEVGVSLRQGYPVYLVIFFPEPVPGQVLADVQKAEVKFIQAVQKLHPDSEEPSVIGNCQGGWASMLIGADRPDVTGPIVIAGSPVSYWGGTEGSNPMRYKGGLTGGVWLTSLWSDLGNGKFDGANLVSGFEDLNPANTLWSKQYNVYSKVDTEEDRFLEFEKWWGGFYFMTSEEIHFIVNNLFVGNKLESGDLELEEGHKIDLGNLEDPVVVFASKGDNIPPPQQALNWIAKVYGSVENIKRLQQVLVYRVHDTIGHLGIFVSGSVAKKEHQEIIGSLDQIEYLPPGLYEMMIEPGKSGEKDDFIVRFEERTIDDILAMDDGLEDEESFPLVAAVSEANDEFYRTYLRPLVRSAVTEQSAELIRQLNSMRVQRYAISDMNPMIRPVGDLAPMVKDNRKPVPEDNIFLAMEQTFSKNVVNALNIYRDMRDQQSEFMFKQIYTSPWLKMMYPEPDVEGTSEEEQERIAQELRASIQEDSDRWMEAMEVGGFPEGVFRIMLAVAGADQSLDKSEFEIVKDTAKSHKRLQGLSNDELKKIGKEQSRILQTDEGRAIEALAKLLPTPKERKEALEVAEKVIMADGIRADEETALMDRIKAVLGI
jgi:poly(3-hydroxyalkanoate) synthetase/uncharacterized tellurite resistance protein B-like protein